MTSGLLHHSVKRPLVIDEPVEIEVEVEDFRRITDHFRWIYEIYLNLILIKSEYINM